MTGDPSQQVFWFASQALGIVAVLLLGISVALGLAMAGRMLRRPGLAATTLPFVLGSRPLFTGIGVVAGWLAVILGLSFYARKRIGVKTWRWMHRFTIVVYLLALGPSPAEQTPPGHLPPRRTRDGERASSRNSHDEPVTEPRSPVAQLSGRLDGELRITRLPFVAKLAP